jgi:hypothetical protein
MSKYGTVVKIEEGDKSFKVNGVEVPKDFLVNLFAFVDDGANKAGHGQLIAYLCLVPLIKDQGEHMNQYHALSDEAKLALALAPPIYKAIGLDENTERGFVMACMDQLEIEPRHVASMGNEIFGNCRKPKGEEAEDFRYEGNIIQFPSRTVH